MEENKLRKEPAFPSKSQHYSEFVINKGMSKRFYAACAAVQGLLANPELTDNSFEFTVEMSYAIADELLKQENL